MVHFGLASLLLMTASIVFAVKFPDIKDKEKDRGWRSYTYEVREGQDYAIGVIIENVICCIQDM